MRFYLDENFPLLAAAQLRAAGHEVFRAIELHPAGTSDRDLFEDAQCRKAIFLTTDKDFFHTVPFFVSDRVTPTVAITLSKANSANIAARLAVLLESVQLDDDPAAVYLVTDRRILKRR
jgi:predicted nuclease of predicted toxin-antitoxin system